MKKSLNFLIGSHTFVFLESMSHLVSSFVPKSFIFLYDGSGGFISLGISQSWSDQIILSSGFTNGGGGGGGGGLLSGASPSSVFVVFTCRLYADSLGGTSFLI